MAIVNGQSWPKWMYAFEIPNGGCYWDARVFRYNATGGGIEERRKGGSVIHRFVFHNEEVKAVDKVRWSPGQAGLICGWGLFTTVRIVRGEAFAYERHWRRLEKDAALTRLPLNYSSAKVRVQLQDVIRANKVEDGCARIYLVWNTVGFWRSEEKMPDVDLVITSADVPAYPETLRVAVREHGRHAASPLAGVKTTSGPNSGLAGAGAPRAGFYGAGLLSERGQGI